MARSGKSSQVGVRYRRLRTRPGNPLAWTLAAKTNALVELVHGAEAIGKRHLIDGIEVPIFEPAKSIVDCFWYRNKIGLDIALEGLRKGLRSGPVTPDQLWDSARTARVWSVMRPYVEAMVADGA